LPHTKPDHKGVRRYFTIASSPTEPIIRLAMKMPPTPSSYKQALRSLDVGKVVIASQLAGDFLLPEDVGTKLGFIAGGIGVTPFSSHVKYMIDSDKAYNTALYYCANTVAELAYAELWAEAQQKLALTYVPVVAKEEASLLYEKGYITAEMIKRRTQDYAERTWYISGPPGMVNTYTKLLKEIGVKGSRIKTDFFPGAV
jgi:ferredoxin-NADP reductase